MASTSSSTSETVVEDSAVVAVVDVVQQQEEVTETEETAVPPKTTEKVEDVAAVKEDEEDAAEPSTEVEDQKVDVTVQEEEKKEEEMKEEDVTTTSDEKEDMDAEEGQTNIKDEEIVPTPAEVGETDASAAVPKETAEVVKEESKEEAEEAQKEEATTETVEEPKEEGTDEAPAVVMEEKDETKDETQEETKDEEEDGAIEEKFGCWQSHVVTTLFDQCNGWEMVIQAAATASPGKEEEEKVAEVAEEETKKVEEKEEDDTDAVVVAPKDVPEEIKEDDMKETVTSMTESEETSTQPNTSCIPSQKHVTALFDNCSGWETVVRATEYMKKKNVSTFEEALTIEEEEYENDKSMLSPTTSIAEIEEVLSSDEGTRATSCFGDVNLEWQKLISLVQAIPENASVALSDATKNIFSIKKEKVTITTVESLTRKALVGDSYYDEEEDESHYNQSEAKPTTTTATAKPTTGEKTEKTSATERATSKPQKEEPKPEPAIEVDRTDMWKTFEYIESKEWNKVNAIMKKFPQEVAKLTLPIACKDDGKGKRTNIDDSVEASRSTESEHLAPASKAAMKGNTVLHELCKNAPPVGIVSRILDITKGEAAKVPCSSLGYLPLHYACRCYGTSADVVRKLVMAYPEGVRMVVPSSGMLPIHLACKNAAKKDVVLALMPVFPTAIQTKDASGKTPIDYAKEKLSKAKISFVELGGAIAVASKVTKIDAEKLAASNLLCIEKAHANYVKTLTSNNEEVLARIADIVLQNSIKEKRMEENFASERAKIKQLEAKLKETQEKLASKEQELQEKNDLVSGLEIQCKELQDTVAVKENEVETIESQLSLHEQAYTALLSKEQTKLKQMEEENTVLKSKLDLLDSDSKDSKKQVEELSELLKKSESKLASIRGVVAGAVGFSLSDDGDNELRESAPRSPPRNHDEVKSSNSGNVVTTKKSDICQQTEEPV